MKSTLRFDSNGRVDCLYTEAIDLQVLGKLQVSRATDIRYDHTTQQWVVHNAKSDAVLFTHASRSECLAWENQNLQPTSNL